MYVAVATASRAAEEAAPVPAVREAQTHLKPLTFSSTLASPAGDYRSFPLVRPFVPFVKLQSHQASPLCATGCDDVSESEIVIGALDLITRD